MGDFFNELNSGHIEFIKKQHIFFTATSAQSGRINVSPKGVESLACVDNNTIAYLDRTGRGNETAAHILADGRLTIMLCSFDEKPLILRCYGQGRVLHRDEDEWKKYAPYFEPTGWARQIIALNIESVQTSCGYGVPLFEFKQERDVYKKQEDSLSKTDLEKKRKKLEIKYNLTSIDGLPTGLETESEE